MRADRFLGLIAVVAACCLLGCKNVDSFPPDETEEQSQCIQPLVIRDACKISMLSLVARPEAYDGKRIHVVAYLALDARVLKIYPTKEQFEFQDAMASIELEGPYEELERASTQWVYGYVVLSGVFHSAKAGDGRGVRAGSLKEVDVQAPIHPRPEDRSNLIPLRTIDLDEQANQ